MLEDECNKYVENFKTSSPEQLLVFNMLLRTYTDLTGTAIDITEITKKQAVSWVLSNSNALFTFNYCKEHTAEKDFCSLLKAVALKFKDVV